MKTIPIALIALILAGQARASMNLLSDLRSVSVSGYSADATYAQTQSLTTPFTTFSGGVGGLAGAYRLSPYAYSSAAQDSTVTPNQISIGASLDAESGASWWQYGLYAASASADSIFEVGFSVSEPLHYDLSIGASGWTTIGMGIDVLLTSAEHGDLFCYQRGGIIPNLSLVSQGTLLPDTYSLRLNGSIATLVDYLGDEGFIDYNATFIVASVPDTLPAPSAYAAILGVAALGLAAVRRRQRVG